MRDTWNARFATSEYVYGEAPNKFFRQYLDRLPSGRILLPCEGEGRNAVYAASKGWKVTAFDASDVGREKAIKLAQKYKVEIEYTISMAEDYDPGDEKFDFIAIVFAHFVPSVRYSIHQKLINFLAPGGKILLEGYNKRQINNTSGGPKDINMLYSLQEIEEDFFGMHFELLKEEVDHLDESDLHRGSAEMVRMICSKKS